MNLIALNPWHIVDPSNLNKHRFYRQKEADWLPPVDLYESETRYTLLMDLPGFQKENVDIQVENHKIRIAGFRTMPEIGVVKYAERVHGKFVRSFAIPENTDQNAIKAQFVDGVMIIDLPKLAKALPKKILIEAKP